MTSYSHRHRGAGISTADLRDGGADRGSSVDGTPRIVWAGSAQCQTLASVVGGGTAVRADADLATACIRAGATLLVTRHLTSFDIMRPPAAFGPNMRVADAALLSDEQHAIVAQHGELVGVAPIRTLAHARPTLELMDVMEDAACLAADEAIDQAADLINLCDGSPVPVVHDRARLVGVVSTADLAHGSTI